MLSFFQINLQGNLSKMFVSKTEISNKTTNKFVYLQHYVRRPTFTRDFDRIGLQDAFCCLKFVFIETITLF